ncbi:hypothetical protein [Sphingosinicella sp.]|uniref:hypothetical protein n=1 Tax=Sphingosinicella sp. TaxID=1917971 RepID=UPI0040383CD2
MGSQVIVAGAAAFILLAFGGGPRAPRPASPAPQVRGFMMRQQIIIRVPTGARRVAAAAPSLIRWRERGGPRCIAAGQIVGATLLGPSSVDLILRDNSRLRARLESRCPALDYYRGFYVNATADGRICADRDSIRSRAGGECQIDAFRALTPERP